MSATNATQERLEKLGFKGASEKLKILSERKKKMAIAYEHYRFVRPEKIVEFNARLRVNTLKNEDYRTTWQELSFTKIESYNEVPPEFVLTELEKAVDRKCFDSFEVAHIVTNVKVPDPILFGRIEGCADRFFISQWDDDVKIEDILKENEG